LKIVIEKILAGVTLAICVVLLVRLALPFKQRRWLNARWAGFVAALQRMVVTPWRNWRLRNSSQRMADEVIRRARSGGGEWTGNVYRPKSFQRPPKDLEHPPEER
jgi:hypothetical protein